MFEVEISNMAGDSVARRVPVSDTINPSDRTACLTAAFKQLLAEGAPLSGLNFDALHITDCDLSGRDLSGSSFNHAILLACRFDYARLNGVHAMGAQFARSSFQGAQLFGSILKMADFSMTDLTQANFCGAALVEADLRGASLSDTRFDGAALTGATFDHVDFAAGSFAGCSLREAKVGHFLWGNEDVFHPPVTFSGSVFPVRLFEDFLMMAGTMFPRDQIEGGDSDDATPAELTYLREYRELLTFFMDSQVRDRSARGPSGPSLTGMH